VNVFCLFPKRGDTFLSLSVLSKLVFYELLLTLQWQTNTRLRRKKSVASVQRVGLNAAHLLIWRGGRTSENTWYGSIAGEMRLLWHWMYLLLRTRVLRTSDAVPLDHSHSLLGGTACSRQPTSLRQGRARAALAIYMRYMLNWDCYYSPGPPKCTCKLFMCETVNLWNIREGAKSVFFFHLRKGSTGNIRI